MTINFFTLQEEKARLKKAADERHSVVKQQVKHSQILTDAETAAKVLHAEVNGNKMYIKNMKDATRSLKTQASLI